MNTAEAAARYFITLAAAEPEPTPITQMQLHKLLYLAHGWSLAAFGRPLFDARFQAWVHGPVEARVRPLFADCGSESIPAHEGRDGEHLTTEDRSIIESTWRTYSRFSASGLRELTHAQDPWKNARGRLPAGTPSDAPISDESITAYFRAQRARQCAMKGIESAALDSGHDDYLHRRTVPLDRLRQQLA